MKYYCKAVIIQLSLGQFNKVETSVGETGILHYQIWCRSHQQTQILLRVKLQKLSSCILAEFDFDPIRNETVQAQHGIITISCVVI